MLKVHKHESLHSIIYRTHVVNGVSDFTNIITNNGGWVSFPKILEGSIDFYKPIDDSIFLNLLRDIRLAKIADRSFDNPVKYRDELEEFFGRYKGVRKFSHRKLHINYCLGCIKIQIEKYGYSFFKSTWFHNSFCPIHKTDLYTVKAINRNEAIEALGNIYKGIHPKAYESPKYRLENFGDSREYRHKKEVDYIAPCLEGEIKEFIKTNLQRVSKDLLGKNYTSVRYLTEHHMMQKIYELAKESGYEKFREFWRNFAEIKLIYSGVVNRKSITEQLHKSTQSTCHNCEHFACFPNLSIIRAKLDDRLARKCELNQKLVYGYLESIGKADFTNRKIVVRKMSYEQKKEVLSKYSGKRFE